ncbi:hypothetical protein MTsN4n26_25950 [Microbacterium sp. MTN4-26]
MRDRVGTVRTIAAVRARTHVGLLACLTSTVALSVCTVVVALTWFKNVGARVVAVSGLDATDLTTQTRGATALVVLVALLAGAGVWQLARLLAVARTHETETLRARGLSRVQAWVAASTEGATVALIGGLIGTGAGMAAGNVGAASAPRFLGWAAATAALLAIVHTVSSRREEAARVSTRSTRAINLTVPVVVLAVAVIAVWQLPKARGKGFDPVVAIAPAAVLLTGALGVLLVFGILAVVLSRVAASRSGLSPGLPARQVSRRLGVFAVAILLVALTSGQVVFASAYGATWERMTSDSAAAEAGAELRVDAVPSTISPGDVALAREVVGVTAASAALSGAVEIGETTADLVALPVAMAEEVISPAGGLVDSALLALAADEPGTVVAEPLALGEAATGVRVTLSVTGTDSGSADVRIGAVLLDASGAPFSVSMKVVPDAADGRDGAAIAETALPEGADPWRLLAVTTSLSPSLGGSSATVALRSAAGIGGAVLPVSGEVTLDEPGGDGVLWVADGGTGGVSTAAPVGAVVSADLAARLGLGVGERAEFRYAGSGRRGEAIVSAITDVIPGTGSGAAIMLPLEQLLVSQLQRGSSTTPTNAVWAAGRAAAADTLGDVLGGLPVVTAEPNAAVEVVGALRGGWWIATAGAVLLTLVAAFAITQTLASSRRLEIAVLHALGVKARELARMRAVELGGVFAMAVGGGVTAGIVAAALIVPTFVLVVTPGVLPAASHLAFDVTSLAVTLGFFAAGLSLVVAFAGVDVTRRARAATVVEDIK